MKKEIICLSLIALVVLALFGALAHATSLGAVASTDRVMENASNFCRAPLNPDFVRYQQELASGRATGQASGGHGLGHVPPPVDFSHLTGQHISTALRGYPSAYDLRTLGKVSPVKDQGRCGACWAFATYGALESYLLPRESWDFSENNLKNTNGFDGDPCHGGGFFKSTAYLARWSGPVTTADDPYDPYSGSSPPNLPVQKHVQDVYFLPSRGGSLDNDNLKWAVMNYGAVHTGMTWDGTCYDKTFHTYYYNGETPPGHDVAIVGWDDNFDKSKFPTTPPGDGAFIVKNSWGTGWGEGGYFYVSYYDSKIGIDKKEASAVYTAEPTTNYDHVYQYDPLGWITNLGYKDDDTAWFANVFTSTTNEQLSAVSFYTATLDAQYEIYVYKDPVSGPISPDRYVEPSGTIPVSGYHTVELSTKVPLEAGHTFSVVIKLRTPHYDFPIAAEESQENYSSTVTAEAGQSYISHHGTSWKDTSGDANTNVCIKAFTRTWTTMSPSA